MTRFITRCNSCRTAFRISRGQLEARGGKVRCGHCGTIFDARGSLRENPADPGDAALDSLLPNEPESVPTPAPRIDEIDPPTISNGAALGSSDADAAEFRTNLETKQQGSAPEFDIGQTHPAQARGHPVWSGSILLFILLAVQAVYYFRGELAVMFPEAKPQLRELCEALGCELPLPRQPQLMSIETSDLQADTANPAVMVLSATLRNRAAYSQSLPALELTLTDAQDQPLARRVLWARDYLGRMDRAETGFAANTELAIKVYIEAAALRATGYRLYLFFP